MSCNQFLLQWAIEEIDELQSGHHVK